MGKNEIKISDYFNLQGVVHGFFLFFFIFFIGKVELANLILEPTTKWNIFFNIGVWFVLVSFCMDKFFGAAGEAKERRLEKEKNKKEKKK